MKFIDLFNQDLTPNWEKIYSIPCFAAMQTTEQSHKWHKEGNVAKHTESVVSQIEEELEVWEIEKDDEIYLIMMAAALCHDLGKPVVTKFDEEKQDYTCPYHGNAGERIVRKLFFDEDIYLREKVCWLVKNHMRPFYLIDKNGDEVDNEGLKRLSLGPVPLMMLLMLNKADALACENDIESGDLKLYKNNKLVMSAIALGCYYRPYDFERSEIMTYTNGDTDTAFDIKPCFTVYMMVGLPGAGKDTWITNNIPNVHMLCRDNIRKEIGIDGEKPQGNEEQENEVSVILAERLTEYCVQRQDCVVNNTNISKRRRNEIKDIILPFNPRIVYVYVEAPSVEVCKERRSGQIAPKVFNKMMSEFDFPERSEYDELIIYKQRE